MPSRTAWRSPLRGIPTKKALVKHSVSRAAFLMSLLCLVTWAQTDGAAQGGGTERGDVLWEDRFDASVFEQAFSSAAARGRLFVAGFVSTPDFSRDFVVRAYDAQTGALIWYDRVDRGSDDFALAVTTDGRTVWVSGNTRAAPGQPDVNWLVRAYEATSGELLWQDVFDRGGGFDAVQNRSLLAANGVVHVGGSSTTPATLRVDSPEASAGLRGPIVWQIWSRPMTPPASGALVEAASVAQPDGDARGDLGCRIGNDSGPSPFPAGSLAGAVLVVDRGSCAVSQKAANAAQAGATAVILVMLPDQRPLSFGGAEVDIPVVSIPHDEITDLRSSVDAGSPVVVTISDEFAGTAEATIRSYDALSGALLWQHDRDRGGPNPQQARSLAVTGRQLFVAGVASSPGAEEVALRAYHAKTGVLQWEHYTPGVQSTDPDGGFTFARRIVAQGDRVFVGSTVETPTGAEFVVQAHDAATGVLVWQDRPGDRGPVNFLDDIAVHGDQLIGVGTGGPACGLEPSNCNVQIRSYDATIGALRWQRNLDFAGLDDYAMDVRVAQGMVFLSMTGSLVSPDGGQWWLQSLDSRSGEIRWESTGGILELPQDLTLYEGRLFVPGRSIDAVTGNWDFIVRAYDARSGR